MSQGDGRNPGADFDTRSLAEEQFGTATRLGRIYAEALYNAAEQDGKAAEVGEEFAAFVREVLDRDPQVDEFLRGMMVGRAEKDRALRRALEGRVEPLFLNFLLVVNRHERLDQLRVIYRSYRELTDERAGRVRVRVRSAVELAEDQRQRLAELLRAALGKEPVLEPAVDPDLLGGMIVQVGDAVYDGSVRTRLENMRTDLLLRSSHEIQTGRDRFRTD
ncbi:MAG TPA: ATP synthase F1 subunit delta [Gemmataceae bacterium]